MDTKKQLTISRAKQFDRCTCLVIFSGKVIPVNTQKSVFAEIICAAGEYSDNIAEQFWGLSHYSPPLWYNYHVLGGYRLCDH